MFLSLLKKSSKNVLKNSMATSPNSGHTATLRSAKIRQSRTSHTCQTLYTVMVAHNYKCSKELSMETQYGNGGKKCPEFSLEKW